MADRRSALTRLVAVAGAGAVLGSGSLLAAGFARADTAECSSMSWGFDHADDLVLNGNAERVVTADGTVLRVSPAYGGSGSAFTAEPVSLADDASFSTYFSFRFSEQWVDGADGLVFVVQTQANNVGSWGGGIGYEGIEDSVGIEFDSWFNEEYGDIDDNHVGIDLDGSILSDPVATLPWQLDDPAAVHHAWVDFDGTTDTLEVRVAQTATRPAAPFLTKVVDLETVLGSTDAFVGFTSATGGDSANHDVITWQLNACLDPVGDPGPGPDPEPGGCIEDGLQSLAGQLVSDTVHGAEPTVGKVDVFVSDLSSDYGFVSSLAPLLHTVNCSLVVPLEDELDQLLSTLLGSL